jgi:hypothetical protein
MLPFIHDEMVLIHTKVLFRLFRHRMYRYYHYQDIVDEKSSTLDAPLAFQ